MKKKLFVFAAGLVLAISINGQTLYVPGGTGGIGNSIITGNVGIGTSAPNSKLQVLGAIESATQSGSDRKAIQMFINSNYGGIDVFDHDEGDPLGLILNESGGNVGIGTDTPAGKLSIRNGTYGGLLFTANNGAGWTTSYGKIQAGSYSWGDGSPTATNLTLNPDGGNVGIGTNAPAGKLSIRNGTYGGLLITANDGAGWTTSYGKIQAGSYSWGDGSPTATDLALNPDGGSVGIGITDPGSYKLNVWGSIRAHEIVVNTDGADFVFDAGYKLLSLSEVEKFILKNKHLPDIQPASDMIENGMNMSEMQTRFLQKLEEITLYIIELNKTNESQNKEIEMLKQKIESLKVSNY